MISGRLSSATGDLVKVRQARASYSMNARCTSKGLRINKKRKVTKLEETPGMLITPEMGGKIVLSVLQKDKDHMNQLRAEM